MSKDTGDKDLSQKDLGQRCIVGKALLGCAVTLGLHTLREAILGQRTQFMGDLGVRYRLDPFELQREKFNRVPFVRFSFP